MLNRRAVLAALGGAFVAGWRLGATIIMPVTSGGPALADGRIDAHSRPLNS